jgi:hypothetical protein
MAENKETDATVERDLTQGRLPDDLYAMIDWDNIEIYESDGKEEERYRLWKEACAKLEAEGKI